jgi:hypothetical protein
MAPGDRANFIGRARHCWPDQPCGRSPAIIPAAFEQLELARRLGKAALTGNVSAGS